MKITTIGGGNGQSNLLDAFALYGPKHASISSIVSMSDDGRTTGELMRAFDSELGLHLPPTGDLRKCMYSFSGSGYRLYFKFVFETKFQTQEKISHFSTYDLFDQVHKELLFFGQAGEYKQLFEAFSEKKGALYEYIEKHFGEKFMFHLPLNSSLSGHKFGNILMALLYYNFEKDYDTMLDFMHDLLEVKGNIIPITTKKAFIRAILGNGEVIETQDRISNVANYSSGIADLELMESSVDADYHKKACKAILNSDFIVIGPGDLFTSIISNFIIGGIEDCIKGAFGKIIYIGNSTNKGGETMGLTHLDFINKIERFLGRKIDIFVVNNKRPELSQEEFEAFKNDISVKGGDYVFLSNGEKAELKRRKIKVYEADLLGEKSFYKHSKKKILQVLCEIFDN